MRTSTKILIYLAVWKRPLITELCFTGINRLRRSFNIDALAVISEEEMIPLCDKYNVRWVMYKNEPLGEKKNYGLSKAKEIDFDYLMEIGSDDLILDELVEDYLRNYIGKYEFFGVSDALHVDTHFRVARRITSKTCYGAGRMISRRVLEDMGWTLWAKSANRGLDQNSLFNMRRRKISYHMTNPMKYPGVIDVKSMENIWKFNYFLGVEYDLNNVLDKLSVEEKELLEECYRLNTISEDLIEK
jgi:hypothetical protein